MSILNRIRRLVSANISDLLDRAEDPEKMLNELLREMRTALQEAKSEVAKSIADEQRLAEKQHQAASDAEQWDARAQRAVEKGDDELAKQALARRNAERRQAEALQQAWQGQKTVVDQLKAQVEKLELRLQEAEGQRDILLARAQRARAQARATQVMASFEEHAAFDRLEDGISDLEAQAEVPVESTLDAKLEGLAEDEQLEADLAELKQRLAGQKPT